MTRRFTLLASSLIATGAVPLVLVISPMTAFAADVTLACSGDVVGTTFTLDADCNTTVPLTVPPGVTTVDGADLFTITATDIGGGQWNGAILSNETPGQTMNIQNLTVQGPVGGFQVCTLSGNTLVGILFDDASGSIDNVTVDHIWQQTNLSGADSCQTGRAIVARGLTGTPRNVTITNTTVRDYQKNGIEARGAMTMNVSGSTMGPPNNQVFGTDQHGLIAQNGLVYVSSGQLRPSGTAVNNPAIYGSGNNSQPPPNGPSDSTAVNIYGATNVTIDHNTIVGAKTNFGFAVVAGSTGIVISFNSVTRSAPDTPDLTGIGIGVSPPTARISVTDALDPLGAPAAATLICNTFSGWIAGRNIVGAIQIPCVPLPNGFECQNYLADVLGVEGGTAPFTWSVVSGTLPPGLSMDPATGAITGIPTAVGTFNFTVQVVDSSEPNLTATTPQSITIAPGCEADLALTKVVSNTSPNVGDQVTFTVTLTNNGPDTATNVQVTDLVPAGMTLISATPSQGTYASATGLWTVGTVTTATPQTLQLVVTIASTGAQTNTATISASDQPDPNTGNNTASASVAPPTTTTTTTTTSTTMTTTPAVLPPAPTTTIGSGSGVLPPTGTDGSSTLYIGLAVLALGSLVVIVTRRRARA